MASVQDLMIAQELLILFLAYNVKIETSSTLLKLRHCGFHISRYGAHISPVNLVMAGWIARDAFHVVSCLYCCVTGRT